MGWSMDRVHGVVYGPGPGGGHGPGPWGGLWTGSMGWSMDLVHGVVYGPGPGDGHGPRFMFCICCGLIFLGGGLFFLNQFKFFKLG